MVPPNIVEDQFMNAGVTGVASGQNAKNQTGARNMSAAMLMARPNLPSDHRRGGRGGPRSRLQTRQLMVMAYEVRMETPPSELMAFSAVAEPRLMQASKELTTEGNKNGAKWDVPARRYLREVRQVSSYRQAKARCLTRDSQREPGNPSSRANDQICLDAVATSLTQHEMSKTMTMVVMTFTAA